MCSEESGSNLYRCALPDRVFSRVAELAVPHNSSSGCDKTATCRVGETQVVDVSAPLGLNCDAATYVYQQPFKLPQRSSGG
jgi:hypothetical protein